MARPPNNNVEPSDIAEVATPEPRNDAMARNEIASFAHEENMQKTQLGLVGWIWGSKSEKPGNIAGIVLIILLVFIGCLLFKFNTWDLFADTLTALMSTVTLLLGYLFGSSGKSD